MHLVKQTVDGVKYALSKPVALGECTGCIGKTSAALCSALEGACVEVPLVWQLADPTCRNEFEMACVAQFAMWRDAGNKAEDNGAPLTHEALCWKTDTGEYGVIAVRAAWWGWRAGKGLL